MLEVLITSGVGVLSGAISAVISYYATKKKYQAEVKLNDISNMSDALLFWVSTSESLKLELELLHEKCTKLLERNDLLEKDMAELKRHMYSFMALVCLANSCRHRQPLNEEEFNERFKD